MREDPKGKTNLVIKWQRTWLNCVLSVLQKKEIASDTIGYLAEEISKQNIEGATWFLLSAHSKMQEERDELKKELLNKKEAKLGGLGNFQPTYIAESENACAEEPTQGVAGQPFDKEVMGTAPRLNQSSQQRQEQRWDYTSKDTASLN